jgi:choline-sulfatase
MEATNLVFILSDQHSRDITGCYGHSVVQTPNIDRLASRGTRFANAYTNCPICVPARASLATGRYVHQIGHWDNAFPYYGNIPSWGHRVRQQGHVVDSVGKLHFRGPDDDNGFSREVEPLHVVEGVGDVLGCIRDAPPIRAKHGSFESAGPGDSTYLQYDARNGDAACQWLGEASQEGKPWVLFVSLVCPHPPYIAPQELYDRYPHEAVELPAQWRKEEWPDHPTMEFFRRFFDFSKGYDEATLRRLAATYYGMCTYVDGQIGRVLDAVDANGFGANTRIIYSSDHGECLGARGIFGKFTMYEESAAVPLVLSGPDVPQGKVCNTPVSLVDCFPTVLDAVGAEAVLEDEDLPGASLWGIAAAEDTDRTVFSEYHAVGSRRGYYMLRDARYKYIYHVEARPQLFDLTADPQECDDLALKPEYARPLQVWEERLRQVLDPDAVDAQARQDQAAKVEAFGGEEAVRQRGTFENSPVPGEAPGFRHQG